MLKYFEEGMELVSELRDYLNKAELKVVQITDKMKKETEEETEDDET
jgi:exonuclease VII small subunit